MPLQKHAYSQMTGRRDPDSPKDERRTSKRQRLQAGQTGGRKRVRDQSDSTTQEQQQQGASENPTSQNITNNAAPSNPIEPMSAILARYKIWRKAGSPHESLCFECHKPGDAVPCETCRRSYHDSCKPKDSALSTRNGAQQWFCPVCVCRGWHVTPPITPPDSPVLTPSGGVTAVSNPNPLRLDNEAGSAGYSPAQLNTRQSHPPLSTPATTQTPRPTEEANQCQQRIAQKQSTAASAPRKSRFNTLPEEVDSALWVVSRELECVPLLRQNVSDLESEISRLRQDLSIQRNELMLTRGIVQRARASEAELQRLRSEATGKQTSADETEALRAKNKEYEAEIASLHGQLEDATKKLQEWKKNLSSMIGGN